MCERHHLSPESLRYLLHEGPFPVGESRALSVLQVNRTTLGRWLSGQVKVPHSAALVLRQLAEGIPPEGGDHWRGFQLIGNEMVTPTGERISARHLEKWSWFEGMRKAQIAALERRVAELQSTVDQLRRVGDSANDAVVTAPVGRPAIGA